MNRLSASSQALVTFVCFVFYGTRKKSISSIVSHSPFAESGHFQETN